MQQKRIRQIDQDGLKSFANVHLAIHFYLFID